MTATIPGSQLTQGLGRQPMAWDQHLLQHPLLAATATNQKVGAARSCLLKPGTVCEQGPRKQDFLESLCNQRSQLQGDLEVLRMQMLLGLSRDHKDSCATEGGARDYTSSHVFHLYA